MDTVLDHPAVIALRAENERLLDLCKVYGTSVESNCREIERLETENERLKSREEAFLAYEKGRDKEVANLRAENERLREALAEVRSKFQMTEYLGAKVDAALSRAERG